MRAEEKIISREAYPSQLLVSGCKPDFLWYLGDVELLKLPMVSVVGTRKASKEGIARTQRITKTLVSQGICVVSGLAEGVDVAAHTTALQEHGATIAVMGTPIDECYPPNHIDLKNNIEMHGLVLSQFEPGSEVQRGNFPRRNELMASLSIMTIVVEAEINSGTRHQVKSAISLGRVVGFLPPLADRGFPWVEEALKSGRGFVINSPRDLIIQLEILRGKTLPSIAPIKEDQLTLAVEEPVIKDVAMPLRAINLTETIPVSVPGVSNEHVAPEKEIKSELPERASRRSWLFQITKCRTWILSLFKK